MPRHAPLSARLAKRGRASDVNVRWLAKFFGNGDDDYDSTCLLHWTELGTLTNHDCQDDDLATDKLQPIASDAQGTHTCTRTLTFSGVVLREKNHTEAGDFFLCKSVVVVSLHSR